MAAACTAAWQGRSAEPKRVAPRRRAGSRSPRYAAASTKDALKLARLHAAGQLRPVLVPTLELEALRDLVRARENLRGDPMATRHRIGKLLLRRGLIFAEPGDPWASQRHLAWLGSVSLEDRLAQIVPSEYVACHLALLRAAIASMH